MQRFQLPSSLPLLLCLGVLLGYAPTSLAEASPVASQELPRPKRVILISMDTVGAAHVSGYAMAKTTPELARMVQEGGVLFRDFYGASNYTLPSHMAMFTGRDAAEHAVQHPKARLSDSIPTLAEIFQAAGYRTRGWHEGAYIAGHFGFDKGFETYTERARVSMVRDGLPEVLDWIRASAGESSFMFFHTYAAHAPYGGLKRYRREHPERKLPNPTRLETLRERLADGGGKKIRKATLRQHALFNYFLEPDEEPLGITFRVGAEFPSTPNFKMDIAQMKRSYHIRIREIDTAIGRIRKTLEELGEWEDTLLVVTADHGEAFFEHGYERHDYLPFNEVIKVPLIVSYPALLKQRASREITGLSWHLDLMPTILSLAGLELPAGAKGLDLAPLLAGEGNVDPERAIFPAILRSASAQPQYPLKRVMLEQKMKWIAGHWFYGAKDGLLFQVGVDPEESSSLREGRPEEFARMQAAVETYERRLVAVAPIMAEGADAELSEEEINELRALGYFDDDEDEEDE